MAPKKNATNNSAVNQPTVNQPAVNQPAAMLHEQILRSTQLHLQVSMFLAINMAQGERFELWHNYMAKLF